MFLLIGLLLGTAVFLICWFLKKYEFFGLPTPPIVFNLFLGCVCLVIFLSCGVGAREWSGMATLLIFVYGSFCIFKIATKERLSTRARRMKIENPIKTVAPEDDPNWSSYRPHKSREDQ